MVVFIVSKNGNPFKSVVTLSILPAAFIFGLIVSRVILLFSALKVERQEE
jgi:hypothetical protein